MLGARRVGDLPRRDQDGRRVVPEERARAGDRDLQRRHEHGRDPHAAAGSLDRAPWGWQWAFIVTGALGFLWLLLWIPLYRDPALHPRVTRAELGHIRSDGPDSDAPVPWVSLLRLSPDVGVRRRQAARGSGLVVLSLLAAEVSRRAVRREAGRVALPLIVVYLIADVGSVGGGWLSSALIKRGWSVNRARKTAMLAMALPDRADRVRVAGAEHVGRRAHRRRRGGGAPGVVGERVYAGERHVPTIGRRIGGRHRRVRRGDGRRGLSASDRARSPGERQRLRVRSSSSCGVAYVIAWTIIHLIVPRLEPAPIGHGEIAARGT